MPSLLRNIWQRIGQSVVLGLLALPVLVRLLKWAGFWAVVWALQWQLAPTVFVSSRQGLTTLFQALPATAVALLVLILASLLAIAQQVSSLWATRSVIVLFEDERTHWLAIRPLIIAVASLMVGGLVPDTGQASAQLTAGTATLTLSTAALIASSVNGLARLFSTYTAPRNFVQHCVLRNFEQRISFPFVGLARYKIPLLGDMVRNGIRRGEATTVATAVEGLVQAYEQYAAAAARTPSIRLLPTESGGKPLEAWFARDFADAIYKAAEESMKGGTPEGEFDTLIRCLEHGTHLSIDAGLILEAEIITEHLGRFATSSHQVNAYGTVNIPTSCLTSLARIEAEAEGSEQLGLAASTLALWSLAVAYVATHFNAVHPLFIFSLVDLGPNPPWDDAEEIVRDAVWQRRWGNKLDRGPGPCLQALRQGRTLLARGIDPSALDPYADGQYELGTNRSSIAWRLADAIGTTGSRLIAIAHAITGTSPPGTVTR